jgi:hypothetical protein
VTAEERLADCQLIERRKTMGKTKLALVVTFLAAAALVATTAVASTYRSPSISLRRRRWGRC